MKLKITPFAYNSWEVTSAWGVCLATKLETGFELIDIATCERWLTLDLSPGSIQGFYAFLASN